jgi:hypothetical protein
MLSIERLREAQPKLKDWSDGDVEKLRDNLDALADILFDRWLEKRNKEKQT